MRTSGMPQTVDEARAYGWAWLSVRCLVCRRGTDKRLADLAGRLPSVRLANLAARLVCQQCQGRRLEFSLGMYVQGAGQPWPRRCPVEFRNGFALPASRE